MSSHSLIRKYRYAGMLMKAQMKQRRHAKPQRGHNPLADTTRGQGRILATLKLQDGIATRDLAYILGLRVASLNELLAKLEAGGLISREPAEDDRRVMLIRLTEAGRNTEQHKPRFPNAFASLSGEEQEQLSSILDKIIAQLEGEIAPDAEDPEFERWGEHMRRRLGEEKFQRLVERTAEHSDDLNAWEWRRRHRRLRGHGKSGRD